MEHIDLRVSHWVTKIVAVAAIVVTAAVTVQGTPALSAPQTPTASAAAPDSAAQRAAPARADKKDRAVYFIHGYSRDGDGAVNCNMWNKTKDYFKDQKWTGKLITWGFYKGNTNCTAKYNGTNDSDLKDVSKSLAWHIYNNYTSKGKTVDVVAWSLGGIVIRNAIVRVKKGQSGFPKKLYVEDVVTLGAPHQGADLASLCFTEQCKQVRSGSDHIKWLNKAGAANHQATGDTNWTVIGSYNDDVVPVFNATDLHAQHKIRYSRDDGVEHNNYYTTGTGNSWTYWRSADYGRTFPKYVNTGSGPIRSIFLAAYYHSIR